MNYTVIELKQIAKEKGFKGYSKLKKAELVKLLAKHDELKLKNKKKLPENSRVKMTLKYVADFENFVENALSGKSKTNILLRGLWAFRIRYSNKDRIYAIKTVLEKLKKKGLYARIVTIQVPSVFFNLENDTLPSMNKVVKFVRETPTEMYFPADFFQVSKNPFPENKSLTVLM
jgi:hypothetical protein